MNRFQPICVLLFRVLLCILTMQGAVRLAAAPNILIAISDDQSWEHVGVYGADWIDTPNLDRLASEGMRFTHAYAQVPSCSTARATLLLGREPWQLQEASTLWSTVPARYPSLMDILGAAGYRTGYTRKGWGPGSNTLGGRTLNPAGPSYGSFTTFHTSKPAGQPFCFWFGSQDPHRSYTYGSGLASGKHTLEDVEVPGFLPDSSVIRTDLLDYGYEIERFDREVGEIVAYLENLGELDNTIFIVTSDNGLPFPGAKANLYDHGTRVPLIIRYPAAIPAGAVYGDFIGFSDILPTLLEALEKEPPSSVTGFSHWNRLTGSETGQEPVRPFMPLYLERHSICRPDMLGYPMRAIRTKDWLYIRNFEPDRWPAGDPPNYRDVDGSPSKTYLLNLAESLPELYQRSFGKRPEEELYAVRDDPFSLHNLASDTAHAATRTALWGQLERYLRQSLDPRVMGFGYILESNPYTRGGLDEYYGGVEVLNRYHPVRLARFKAWLKEDDDGDGLQNLIELGLFGDPHSPNADLFDALIMEDLPNVFSLRKIQGVWPWEIGLAESPFPVEGVEILDDRISFPSPGEGRPNGFLRITNQYQFSAP